MAKIHHKKPVAQSCYDLARQRLRLCFDRFDKVVVSFSGGKDSTACLRLALEVARETGQLPLDVYTYDEEVIAPETVAYLERVRRLPDVRFQWFCLPIKMGNACSKKSPYWYSWDPAQKAKWVRPLPDGAITELAGFRPGMALADCTPLIWGPKYGQVCNVMGIRCQESMSRYNAIAVKVGDEAFLTGYDGAKWINKAYPIYDWNLEDVWLAPHLFNWDYNSAYDLMEAIGLTQKDARCSPPYGEQTIRALWKYAILWPDLWPKMIDRVPGAATAARYANTQLYGALAEAELSAGQTWQDRTLQALQALDPKARRTMARLIQGELSRHKKRTSDPCPDAEPHPLSGYCWRSLFGMAQVGADKFDRQSQKVRARARQVRERNGIFR